MRTACCIYGMLEAKIGLHQQGYAQRDVYVPCQEELTQRSGRCRSANMHLEYEAVKAMNDNTQTASMVTCEHGGEQVVIFSPASW